MPLALLAATILLTSFVASACALGPQAGSPDHDRHAVQETATGRAIPAEYARVQITVRAGSSERIQTPVTFELQRGPRSAALLDPSGRQIPLQVGPDDRYWFIVDHLEAGEERSYTLVDISTKTDPVVTATNTSDYVTFATEGRPFIRYNFEPTPLPAVGVDSIYQRGGYIHPVLSPSGVQLTDDYPPNHLHHHGIWAAWTNTEFQGRTPDFWNMGNGTGTVEPVSLDSVWSGPVFAGLRARHAYIDLSAPVPTRALDESWTIRVFPSIKNGMRMFDLVVTQETAGESALHLPEYRYGGVGFRGHRQWNGEENTFFLTSEGRDRSDGHATRARWCHIGGYVDGRLAGTAVLDHPRNFRSPQPMRIHPSEPFFNYAPSQLGHWSIEPGDVYSVRYRFVTYDGEPEAAVLDRLWNDFADPPVVLVDSR